MKIFNKDGVQVEVDTYDELLEEIEQRTKNEIIWDYYGSLRDYNDAANYVKSFFKSLDEPWGLSGSAEYNLIPEDIREFVADHADTDLQAVCLCIDIMEALYGNLNEFFPCLLKFIFQSANILQVCRV